MKRFNRKDEAIKRDFSVKEWFQDYDKGLGFGNLAPSWLEDEFQRMKVRVGEMLDLANIDQDAENRPLVYGWSFRVIDGKPSFQEFGNVDSNVIGAQDKKLIRQPLFEVIEGIDDYKILFELPGVSKESIKLTAKPNSVTIEAKEENREYSRTVEMPTLIDASTVKSTFRNGVLEVRAKKPVNMRQTAVAVKIE